MKLPQLSGLIKVQHSICTQRSDSYTPFVCSVARLWLLYCEISARRGVGAVSYQILMESGLRWERKDSSSHFLVTPEKRGIVGLLTWTHQIHNSWVMLNSLANTLLAATTTHRWTVFPSKNVFPVWSEAGIVPCVERTNEYKVVVNLRSLPLRLLPLTCENLTAKWKRTERNLPLFFFSALLCDFTFYRPVNDQEHQYKEKDFHLLTEKKKAHCIISAR